MIVQGIKSIAQTAPKSLYWGMNFTGYGMLAKTLTEPSSISFFQKYLTGPLSHGAGIVKDFWAPILGKVSEATGLSAAGSWIGSTASSAATYLGTTTAFKLPAIAALGIEATAVPIGALTGIGAAIPLVGLGIRSFTNHLAKKAAAKVAAEQATKAAGNGLARTAGHAFSQVV